MGRQSDHTDVLGRHALLAKYGATDKKKNGILFIEDVAEHPYRIERHLTQLLHAGVLANQKAILFGQFTNYTLFPKADKDYKMQSVIDWLRSKVKCPVLTVCPWGMCLPKWSYRLVPKSHWRWMGVMLCWLGIEHYA